MKLRPLAIIAAALLTSCAHTTLYRDGKPVARFEGDMSALKVEARADGSFTWEAETVNHSAATEAQGRAGAGKINAAAALAGAVLLAH